MSVYSVIFSPDGTHISSGSSGHCDHTVRLRNVQTEMQTGDLLQGHTGQVDSYSVVFS
ncbi:hypothetical protein EDC04DRAFT_2565107 [Pisolithus marmoratus]|nr:hypothetical protein EDC04DRAFT_2565107 [Pisolithus marmoratus]